MFTEKLMGGFCHAWPEKKMKKLKRKAVSIANSCGLEIVGILLPN